MKFCPNCGAPIEEGHKFCANCGAKLAAPEMPSEPVYTDDPAHKYVQVAEGQDALWASWANAEERTVRENMHLNLADGSTAEIAGYLASGGREGRVEKLLSSPRAALWDIHSIVSVTVGEHTWEIPGHN